jgi:hypothetical protein
MRNYNGFGFSLWKGKKDGKGSEFGVGKKSVEKITGCFLKHLRIEYSGTGLELHSELYNLNLGDDFVLWKNAMLGRKEMVRKCCF